MLDSVGHMLAEKNKKNCYLIVCNQFSKHTRKDLCLNSQASSLSVTQVCASYYTSVFWLTFFHAKPS